MPDLIIKPAAQSGNKVIIQDQAGGAVITTADSGATIANATLTAPTVASMANCTFPAGHVIQVVSASNNTWYQSQSLAVVTCTNYTATINKKLGSGSEIHAFFTYTANTYQNNSTNEAMLNLYWVRTAPTSANFWDGLSYTRKEADGLEKYWNQYQNNGGQFKDTSSATGNHTYVATITGGSGTASLPRGALANDGTQSITLMEITT